MINLMNGEAERRKVEAKILNKPKLNHKFK
jgi:hypothetical protein